MTKLNNQVQYDEVNRKITILTSYHHSNKKERDKAEALVQNLETFTKKKKIKDFSETQLNNNGEIIVEFSLPKNAKIEKDENNEKGGYKVSFGKDNQVLNFDANNLTVQNKKTNEVFHFESKKEDLKLQSIQKNLIKNNKNNKKKSNKIVTYKENPNPDQQEIANEILDIEKEKINQILKYYANTRIAEKEIPLLTPQDLQKIKEVKNFIKPSAGPTATGIIRKIKFDSKARSIEIVKDKKHKLHFNIVSEKIGQGTFGAVKKVIQVIPERDPQSPENFLLNYKKGNQVRKSMEPDLGRREVAYHYAIERDLETTLKNLKNEGKEFDFFIPQMKSRSKNQEKLVYEMNQIQGESLSTAIKNQKFQSQEEIQDISQQIIKKVAILHEAGYAHMDIKPDNIMITPNNEVKLIDLGCAHKSDQQQDSEIGTPLYMAPEITPQGDEYNPIHADWHSVIMTLNTLNGYSNYRAHNYNYLVNTQFIKALEPINRLPFLCAMSGLDLKEVCDLSPINYRSISDSSIIDTLSNPSQESFPDLVIEEKDTRIGKTDRTQMLNMANKTKDNVVIRKNDAQSLEKDVEVKDLRKVKQLVQNNIPTSLVLAGLFYNKTNVLEKITTEKEKNALFHLCKNNISNLDLLHYIELKKLHPNVKSDVEQLQTQILEYVDEESAKPVSQLLGRRFPNTSNSNNKKLYQFILNGLQDPHKNKALCNINAHNVKSIQEKIQAELNNDFLIDILQQEEKNQEHILQNIKSFADIKKINHLLDQGVHSEILINILKDDSRAQAFYRLDQDQVKSLAIGIQNHFPAPLIENFIYSPFKFNKGEIGKINCIKENAKVANHDTKIVNHDILMYSLQSDEYTNKIESLHKKIQNILPKNRQKREEMQNANTMFELIHSACKIRNPFIPFGITDSLKKIKDLINEDEDFRKIFNQKIQQLTGNKKIEYSKDNTISGKELMLFAQYANHHDPQVKEKLKEELSKCNTTLAVKDLASQKRRSLLSYYKEEGKKMKKNTSTKKPPVLLENIDYENLPQGKPLGIKKKYKSFHVGEDDNHSLHDDSLTYINKQNSDHRLTHTYPGNLSNTNNADKNNHLLDAQNNYSNHLKSAKKDLLNEQNLLQNLKIDRMNISNNQNIEKQGQEATVENNKTEMQRNSQMDSKLRAILNAQDNISNHTNKNKTSFREKYLKEKAAANLAFIDNYTQSLSNFSNNSAMQNEETEFHTAKWASIVHSKKSMKSMKK